MTQLQSIVLGKLRSHPSLGSYFNPAKRPVHTDGLEEQPIPVLALDSKDPRIEQAREEAQLQSYEVRLTLVSLCATLALTH